MEKPDKINVECSDQKTDLVADTTNTTENNCSDVIKDDIIETSASSIKECEQIKPENSEIKAVDAHSDNDVLICSNISQHSVVHSCNDDVFQEKLLESKKELSHCVKRESCNIKTSLRPPSTDKEVPQEQLCNDIDSADTKQTQNVSNSHDKDNASTDTKQSRTVPNNYDNIDASTNTKQSQNVPNNYDKINSVQTESKQLNDPVSSSKLNKDSVETEVRSFNNSSVCNDFSKPEMSIQPLVVPSVNEKQFDSSLVVNNYCKPLSDSALPSSSTTKPYSSDSLSTEFCKTDTVLTPNAKQYNNVLLNDYQKLDVIQQPELNKSMFSKEKSAEFNKNSHALPVSTNSSPEGFKVLEQLKTKASEKNYSRSVLADNAITVPKYDTSKHEKQSKRTTPSPKTLPYRMPSEVVPTIEKSRLHDYLSPMGFVNYQKMNNPVAVGHSDTLKTTKDMYSDKKTDSVNANLQKDKDTMNLPKSIDNSLLYSSVMQQSPYTDQSMMHLTLHHHLAHSSQYHHTPPISAQVPPPVHQTKSRSKKSEQRRLAQQSQSSVALVSQQPTPSPSLPSHTQSYHHHHQTATYMMPQHSPSSPYHHSVIQHRMGQQGGSCSSADFYLSHSNQHAVAAAAQIASCNLSKLQQMTNGLDHHRRHIASPSSSPASSPATMTPPPPAASAAAAHLIQQTYHKLYQQAGGQTNQSRQYGHQSRNSPTTPNAGLMSMQYGAPPPFNGYRVTPQSTPPPSAAGYMNQTSGQLQYATHSQDPHHQNGAYPASAYNSSYLQPLNGSMHR